jgi:hypothetical protein
MVKHLFRHLWVLCLGGLLLIAARGVASPLAACNSSFTICAIPENQLLQLAFAAISGDVAVLEPDHTTVSDVFRIFNNVFDTGGGTGIGNLVFMYSSDESSLPDPSSYSANVKFIQEDPSGFTHYLGNGTDYVLGAPEPATFGLLGLGIIAMAIRKRLTP